MTDTSAVIEINDAAFGYKSGMHFRPVISHVSFTLEPGRFLVLEGPNGCGKTTILLSLLGMGAYYKGHVKLNMDRMGIGYIPQEAALDRAAPASVYDVVRSAFPFGNFNREQIRDSLDRVGLLKKCSMRYGSLSGGQRRRVLLARAIACRSSLVMLDEPTANVDRDAERVLESLLYSLLENGDTSILATTHAAHWARQAERITLGYSHG